MNTLSRRKFNTVLTFGASSLLTHPIHCSNERPKEKKLGIALVGLGTYSEFELAPALQETKYCRLAAIVTGTPEKAEKWSKKYNIPQKNIYSYDNFEKIKDNDEVDIVYIVLPNALHAKYAILSAQTGKHVICEKPMAVTVAECDAIINTCHTAGVRLSVGYRLHSEPYTQEIKKIVANKRYGAIRYVSADAAYHSVGDPEQWRLNKELSGGGALMNMGVYAIQSAIYGSGMNPISVRAQEFSTRPDYFKDTDETITAQFEFPNGAVGNIFTSHNVHVNKLYSAFDKGWVSLDPANHYGPLTGKTSEGKDLSFKHRRHQTLQMDDFAKHIMRGTKNVAPGEMGKRDMIIVEAIYESIKMGGKKIMLDLGKMGLI